jgi:hypothetical protein
MQWGTLRSACCPVPAGERVLEGCLLEQLGGFLFRGLRIGASTVLIVELPRNYWTVGRCKTRTMAQLYWRVAPSDGNSISREKIGSVDVLEEASWVI